MTLADPHYWARGMLHEVEDETLGRFVMPGVVPKLSRTPGSIAWTGPVLGEHNDEIFGGLLGVAPERRRELVEAGVTGAASPPAVGPAAHAMREEGAGP
jgi:crotonobetainyl-CoA:carnitine CoA-transferase CaiB-like acyl-CoA transferase